MPIFTIRQSLESQASSGVQSFIRVSWRLRDLLKEQFCRVSRASWSTHYFPAELGTFLDDSGTFIGDFGILIGDFGILIGDFGILFGDFGILIGDFGVLFGDFGTFPGKVETLYAVRRGRQNFV